MALTLSHLFTWITSIQPEDLQLRTASKTPSSTSNHHIPKRELEVPLCGPFTSPYHLSHFLVHNSGKADLWSALCLDVFPVSGTQYTEGSLCILNGWESDKNKNLHSVKLDYLFLKFNTSHLQFIHELLSFSWTFCRKTMGYKTSRWLVCQVGTWREHTGPAAQAPW